MRWPPFRLHHLEEGRVSQQVVGVPQGQEIFRTAALLLFSFHFAGRVVYRETYSRARTIRRTGQKSSLPVLQLKWPQMYFKQTPNEVSVYPLSQATEQAC